MKYYLLCAALFSASLNMAQTAEQNRVKATIEQFFEGFHEGDTSKMRSVMMPKVIMQTAYINTEGEGVLVDNEGANQLLNAIANRPDHQKWDERLLNFDIKIDANLANAWVDYEFWFNGNFSHCGVNSFHLVKTEGRWKIIYLIDSRRKIDCQD